MPIRHMSLNTGNFSLISNKKPSNLSGLLGLVIEIQGDLDVFQVKIQARILPEIHYCTCSITRL